MADRYENAGKVMAILAVIFLLVMIVLFFLFEFRFLKRIMVDYEDNIKRVVLNDIYSFMHDLEFYSVNSAKRFTGEEEPAGVKLLEEIASLNPRVSDVKVLNEDGRVIRSLFNEPSSQYPVDVYKQEQTGPNRPYTFSVVDNDRVDELCVAVPLEAKGGTGGYLLINYGIHDLQHQFIMKYATEKLKVGLVDDQGYPLVWPFAEEQLDNFNPEWDSFTDGKVNYNLSRVDLANSGIDALFFFKDNNFDTYRIITIMFLLFALYFLIYHFIVEVINVNNINSYFDNIDFNIFNNLQEGIIIANKSNKVVFANNVAHRIFSGKKVVFGNTRLRDLIGPLDGPDARISLKKSDSLLEIICSPIVKSGKRLGSLVVIGENMEREKLCHNAMDKVFEHLKDGVVFVDREGKIVASNMMARYFLGHMENGMKIDEVSTELADLLESNIGSNKAVRTRLTLSGTMGELLPVFDNNGIYAGTVIFFRNDAEF